MWQYHHLNVTKCNSKDTIYVAMRIQFTLNEFYLKRMAMHMNKNIDSINTNTDDCVRIIKQALSAWDSWWKCYIMIMMHTKKQQQ